MAQSFGMKNLPCFYHATPQGAKLLSSVYGITTCGESIGGQMIMKFADPRGVEVAVPE